MKFIIMTLVLIIFYVSCSMSPAIIRSVYPVNINDTTSKTNYSHPNQSSLTQKNIIVSLQYLNKKNLYYLTKKNKNPHPNDGVSPILTVFKIEIKNNRADKIKIDKNLIVLLDGQGHQYNALNFDAYKTMYPSTYEQSSDYNFLFGQSFIEPKSYSNDHYKKEKIEQPLFQGGYIYKNVNVVGILSFPRLSELIKKFTIIIPDVELYKDNKIIKKIDFKFSFIQTIERKGH